MKNIPNLFTLLNLFFGCIAVIFTLQNGIAIMYYADGAQYIGIPERMGVASLFIGLAGLVDFLDGLVARIFKATSPMGKQLDSLADVVSFGVAPGMILYQFLRMSFARQENGLDISPIWFLPALLFPCAAAFRLAKFNIDETQRYGFKGVPTPAAGILVASIPLIYWYSTNDTITALLLNKWLLYGVILVMAWLMTSNLPIMALKFSDYTIKGNLPKLILLVVAVLSAIFLKWLAVPVVFIFYIIVSLLSEKK
ncbi:CDP-alcohol phosphatidyltransferase family protein [Flavitalea sp. BT771]|uniref:CDP-alcohol phosphatidyltransferase family protein n=1 Tax=Flavitalea sp. BT771 TaxID=3063329 RepID=UPI0026E2C925|nr:CDP-alcohol phosphatidyltransferase family protein [Flavitalea sp. BT771]MDO6431797.1 CDP-alcohol phosphatidyltransferase family protein [Flavitalea sp. BT771]MDV6220706.1 CDP-alcohol phosphatidyltransferase family protein [Flavitalea sp. BT771]